MEDLTLLPGPTDAALLLAVARGQPGCAGELYGRYRDGALGVAISVLGDEMEGEDVVHEVFEELPRMARSYDVHRGSVPQWLYRVVRNRAIDHVRRRAREASRVAAPVPGTDEFHLVPSLAPSPSDELEAEEMLELIGRLDPRHAHLVRLAFVDGWSHSAIAGMTGLPLGTVKTRIRLSLRLIRSFLAEADVTPIPVEATVARGATGAAGRRRRTRLPGTHDATRRRAPLRRRGSRGHRGRRLLPWRSSSRARPARRTSSRSSSGSTRSAGT